MSEHRSDESSDERDIREFAAAKHADRYPCWVCGIPEREVIDAILRGGGVSDAALADYLVEKKGYSADLATFHRVRGHRHRRHHEQQRRSL